VRILRGPARFAIASLALIAILFLFVFPTRSYLAQRRQIAGARHDLNVLRQQNARLEAEAQRLNTGTEIDKIAREQYNMVKQGEQSFAIIAAPTTTTTTP
jgi:cell division protein FtsB